ncbi:MAG: SDR family oxidoreductase [Candidatus Binatia bacterium]|jgi:dTDP-glucose 4,6-dehydratase|nr:SDR family oxidoreductase [Candidatus Binatia bacterium]MDG1958797.1 SDR family oxidoreductase [Candidatus Binatia bacterium]MDG2011022.1 SDR family oxidoreductase [Candidatus Binatia bacterium]
MSRRILITGGAGFIGSHLADRLLADGNEVIAIDNLATGHTRNIEHLAGNTNFRFIHHNVTEYIYIEGHLDVVLHLASLPSPVDYLKLPIPTLKVGAHGTHKALGLARAKGARFMLASTSEVYGDPLVHPQPEDYWGNVNPVGPRGVYDESKRFAEAMTMAYHRYHGLDTRIFRIFNTYGPRMRPDDGRVVTNFINQALHGQDLTVYDDGSRTRSFCYVSDLVEGILRLMDSDEVDPVNLGNPGEMTILEFAEVVRRLTGEVSALNHVVPTDERTKDDPQVRRPDITKARKVLGWEPQVSLDEGLGHTIEYFRELFAAP